MLRDKLMADLKEAMKAGDKARLSTIRLIQSSLKDRDIEVRPEGRDKISDDEILQMLQKMIKQRQESVKLYGEGGRPDLVASEQAEITVISGYLPQQMDEAETKAAIGALIGEIGASSIKDMGKVMAELKARFAGRMDFGKASPMVKQALGG